MESTVPFDLSLSRSLSLQAGNVYYLYRNSSHMHDVTTTTTTTTKLALPTSDLGEVWRYCLECVCRIELY